MSAAPAEKMAPGCAVLPRTCRQASEFLWISAVFLKEDRLGGLAPQMQPQRATGNNIASTSVVGSCTPRDFVAVRPRRVSRYHREAAPGR